LRTEGLAWAREKSSAVAGVATGGGAALCAGAAAGGGAGVGGDSGGGQRRRLGRRARRGLRFGGLGRRGAVGAHRNHHITRRDVSALLDGDALDDPADRRGHVHGRLLGLESHERGVGLDAIAGLDEHVDDGDVLEVAHVGHAHFDEARHGWPRRV